MAFIIDTLRFDTEFESDYGNIDHNFHDKIESIRWSLDTVKSGEILLETNTALTEDERALISDWINEQHTHCFGEEFRNEPFAKYELTEDSDEFSEWERFRIDDADAYIHAIRFLDDHLIPIPYVLDSNDDILVEERYAAEVIELLDSAGIDYTSEDNVHMGTVDWEKSDYSLDLISEPNQEQDTDLTLTEADLNFAEQMQDDTLNL